MIKRLLLIFVLLCSIAIAAPPFITPQATRIGETLVISYPKNPSYQIGAETDLHFHVYTSNGTLISAASDVTCNGHVYRPGNGHIFQNYLALDDNGIDLIIGLSDKNITRTGTYPVLVWCNSTKYDESGFESFAFYATPTGVISDSVAFQGIAILMVGFSFLMIFTAFKLNEFDDKGNIVRPALIAKIMLVIMGLFTGYLILQQAFGMSQSVGLQELSNVPVKVMYIVGMWFYIIMAILVGFVLFWNIILKLYQSLVKEVKGR